MDNTSFQNWYLHHDGIEDVAVAGSVSASEVKTFRSSPTQPPIGGGQVAVDTYDLMFTLDAGTIASEPIPGDTITDDSSVVCKIQSVKTVSVGATPIKYECQCRKQVTTT